MANLVEKSYVGSFGVILGHFSLPFQFVFRYFGLRTFLRTSLYNGTNQDPH